MRSLLQKLATGILSDAIGLLMHAHLLGPRSVLRNNTETIGIRQLG